MQTYKFELCGLDIAFNSSTEAQRVQEAVDYIQKSYDELQIHGSQLGRDKLLVILAIGLADDLFELQKKYAAMLEQNEEKDQEDKKREARLEHILALVNPLIVSTKEDM